VKNGPVARNSFSRMLGSWFGIAISHRIRGWQGVHPVSRIGVHRDRIWQLTSRPSYEGLCDEQAYLPGLTTRTNLRQTDLKAGGKRTIIFSAPASAIPLCANDDETKTCREFTLESIGQTSSGYAPNQRQQDPCSSRR
jgi:hypothetical protein